MKINLKSSAVAEYKKIFSNFMYDIQSKNKVFSDNVNKMISNTGYEPLYEALIELMETYNKVMGTDIAKNDIQKWIDSDRSLVKDMRYYSVGEAAEANCKSIQNSLAEIASGRLSIATIQKPNLDNSEIGESDFIELKHISNKYSKEIRDCVSQTKSKISEACDRNDIFYSLECLIDIIDSRLASFEKILDLCVESIHNIAVEGAAKTVKGTESNANTVSKEADRAKEIIESLKDDDLASSNKGMRDSDSSDSLDSSGASGVGNIPEVDDSVTEDKLDNADSEKPSTETEKPSTETETEEPSTETETEKPSTETEKPSTETEKPSTETEANNKVSTDTNNKIKDKKNKEKTDTIIDRDNTSGKNLGKRDIRFELNIDAPNAFNRHYNNDGIAKDTGNTGDETYSYTTPEVSDNNRPKKVIKLPSIPPEAWEVAGKALDLMLETQSNISPVGAAVKTALPIAKDIASLIGNLDKSALGIPNSTQEKDLSSSAPNKDAFNPKSNQNSQEKDLLDIVPNKESEIQSKDDFNPESNQRSHEKNDAKVNNTDGIESDDINSTGTASDNTIPLAESPRQFNNRLDTNAIDAPTNPERLESVGTGRCEQGDHLSNLTDTRGQETNRQNLYANNTPYELGRCNNVNSGNGSISHESHTEKAIVHETNASTSNYTEPCNTIRECIDAYYQDPNRYTYRNGSSSNNVSDTEHYVAAELNPDVEYITGEYDSNFVVGTLLKSNMTYSPIEFILINSIRHAITTVAIITNRLANCTKQDLKNIITLFDYIDKIYITLVSNLNSALDEVIRVNDNNLIGTQENKYSTLNNLIQNQNIQSQIVNTFGNEVVYFINDLSQYNTADISIMKSVIELLYKNKFKGKLDSYEMKLLSDIENKWKYFPDSKQFIDKMKLICYAECYLDYNNKIKDFENEQVMCDAWRDLIELYLNILQADNTDMKYLNKFYNMAAINYKWKPRLNHIDLSYYFKA